MNPKITPSRMLEFGLIVYLCSTLFSMATMSLGVGVFLLISLTLLLFFKDSLKSESFQFSFDEVFNSPLIRHYFTLSLLLSGACILSLLIAQARPLVFGSHPLEISLLKDGFKLWYFLLPLFLLIPLRALPERVEIRSIRVWLIVASGLALLGMSQFFTGWPRRNPLPHSSYFHATLFLGHHLSTASIFIFPFFIALSLAFPAGQSSAFGFSRRTLRLMSAALGILLLLTWSRTLWIALPFGLMLWAYRKLSHKRFFTLLLGGILCAGAFSQTPQVQLRMHHLPGLLERLEIWRLNWMFFLERPWFGVGWRKPLELTYAYYRSSFGETAKLPFAGHAHNNLLEMLSGTGLIGAAAWLAWNFWILKITWRASLHKTIRGEMSWGLFCAWIVFQINGLTQVNFWEGKVMHQMMWATALILAFTLRSEDSLSNQKHQGDPSAIQPGAEPIF